MLDFTLNDEQRAVQQLARNFAQREIAPVADQFEKDEEGVLAERIIKKAAEVGILGLAVPKDYGGAGGDNVDCSIVLEELAVGCGGIATAVGASWFGQTPILMAANKEQRDRFFPRLASQEGLLVCMAMTEPAGGTDIENPHMHSRTIRSIAKEDGDSLVLNGTKIWPSNSGNSWLYTVIATVDPNLGDEGSLAIVVEDGTPGLSFGRPIKKMGMDADRNSEIIFEDCRVPKANLLGKVGDGARLLQRTLIYNRVGAGAIAVGIARSAFEQALRFAKERTTMGNPLIEHPVIAALFGDMAAEIDAARLLVLRAAWFNSQKGKANMKWASMAKVYASEMAMRVTTDAVQVMGSYGYSKEYGVEKCMRDAKIVQIYIGANEFTQQVVGEELGKEDAPIW